MRRKAKVDDNQSEIVTALRKIGCTVQPLHDVGRGVPDLLVGYHGINVLLEIKDGAKVPSAQKLTDEQITWHDSWRGQVATVNSINQAIDVLQICVLNRK